jgi:hypothetical protein
MSFWCFRFLAKKDLNERASHGEKKVFFNFLKRKQIKKKQWPTCDRLTVAQVVVGH